MSHINESRKPSGIGYPVLQDHGWSQRGVALENRASIISVRIKDRKFDSSEFGEYVEDEETRGDWACWLYWDRQSDADRAVGSWSPIFAARVPVELDGDLPPEGAPPPVPSVTSPGDRFVQIDITGQDGSSYRIIRNTPKDPPQTRYDMVPEPPIGGQTYDFQRSKARPIGKDNEADERYEEKDVSDTPWGSVPGGTVVAVVGATVEDEQREVVLHGDPRLIAAHRGGPPTLSTSVHDLGPRGDINESRSAPLHSMLRVVPRAAGALSLGAGADVLSWNIGRSGQNDTIGGLVTDQGGLQTRHALVSVRDGGPIDVGDRNDVHYLGTDADGNPINMAHLSTLTLFRGHGGDGPLHIKEEFPASLEERGPWRQRVHCGFDKYLEYQLPRDQPQFTYYGKFSWWTENLVGVENPPTTPGGGIPGDGDPPPTITPGGGNPPPPPPTPGPTTPGGGGSVPGGGSGGGGPGTPGGGSPGPSTGGGGGGGSPGTGGGTLGPGPFPLPGQDAPPPLFPGNPPIPNPADRPGFSYSTVTTYHTGMSQDVGGKDTKASTHMEFSSTGLSGRAPLVRDGGKNLSADPSPSLVEFLGWRETSPTTWRALTYGAQEGTGTDPDPMSGQAVAHKYTQEPGKSRSEGGTASGGLAFLPPEVNLTDYASDYAPEGVSRSTAHFVLGPNTKLGFGKPDMGTGGVRTGHTVGGEGGDAVIDRIDSSGTSNEALRLTSEGAAVLGDIASDPSTPTTGAALYSKAGHLYHKHTGGNVTQLTPSNITYVREVSTDTTLTAFDRTVLVDSSAGDVTITLPTGVNGTEYVIKKIYNANTVYVEGTSQQFDRGSILTLDQPQHSVSVKFYSTNSKWYVEHETTWATVPTLFPVMMTTDALGTITADEYSGFGTSALISVGDTRYRTVAPCAGTIHSMNVEITGANPGADSWVVTLYKNGVATALTCTLTGSNLTASDTTNRVAVAAGDVLTVFYDETGTLSHGFAVTFIYEAEYQPFFGCVAAGRADLGNAYYGDLQNARYNSSGLDEAATVFPCNGTIQNFYVHAPTCNSSGDQATLNLRVFDPSAGTWSNVSPAVQIVLDYDTDGDSVSDLVTTFDVEAGKAYQWKCEDTTTSPPGVSQVAVSFVFVPDTPGDIVISGFSDQFFSNPAYVGLMASEADDSTGSTALQANVAMPVAATLQDMYVVLQAAPGATNKVYTATVMKNGSATSLAATVTDPSRTGNDTSNTVSFDKATDTVGLRFTDDSSVSPTWGAWAVVARL